MYTKPNLGALVFNVAVSQFVFEKVFFLHRIWTRDLRLGIFFRRLIFDSALRGDCAKAACCVFEMRCLLIFDELLKYHLTGHVCAI
jgi:hypothetical protein